MEVEKKIRKEGNNFDFILPFSSISLLSLFLFCKHKRWRYSLKRRLGTNSVNV